MTSKKIAPTTVKIESLNRPDRATDALSCTGLVKSFGSTFALAGLSFSLHRGEILGFLGPNGAGKTTTLRIISGLVDADEGEVVIDGTRLSENPSLAKATLAYIPDEPLLYGKLTPLEQLEFVGGLWGLRGIDSKKRAEELLQTLGLWDKRDHSIDSLSRGMKQKVAFAATLLLSPKIILLDEPFTGLDVASARQTKDMLRQFTENGGSVILTTHLLDVAERIAGRVAIIDHGRLLASGTLENLRNQAGSDGTLEDIFLQLTNPSGRSSNP